MYHCLHLLNFLEQHYDYTESYTNSNPIACLVCAIRIGDLVYLQCKCSATDIRALDLMRHTELHCSCTFLANQITSHLLKDLSCDQREGVGGVSVLTIPTYLAKSSVSSEYGLWEIKRKYMP